MYMPSTRAWQISLAASSDAIQFKTRGLVMRVDNVAINACQAIPSTDMTTVARPTRASFDLSGNAHSANAQQEGH